MSTPAPKELPEASPTGRHVMIASASPDWRDEVRSALYDTGLGIQEVAASKQALEAVSGDPAPAAALIDVALEDMTGLGLCRAIREGSRGAGVPILMVCALDSEIDRVLAFETGADDFLAYPFFARELGSRVRAVLRRGNSYRSSRGETNRHSFGPLRVDLARTEVLLDGRPLRLTMREFAVFRALVEREGRVVTRAELLSDPGTDDAASLRVVDTHVKSIRRKLGGARDLIETVRGVGYRFCSDADDPARQVS